MKSKPGTAIGVLITLSCVLLAPLLADVPLIPRDIRLSPPDQPIPLTFFGMHIHRLGVDTGWPSIPFGSWRLWDARVTWPQIETKPGQYDWKLLDEYQRTAASKQVDLVYDLGGYAPEWYAARKDPSNYGDAQKGYASEPRDLDAWRTWVRAVATRYRGKFRAYELWNEPDMKGFKSPEQTAALVQLAQAAYQILKEVDPGAVVLSPAFGTAPGLARFLQLGGAAYCDAIAYHFYAGPRPPEAIVKQASDVHDAMRPFDVHKPIWDTEAGWDRDTMNPEDSAAYVARFLVLHWALGLHRFYFYSWDNQRFALRFVAPDGSGSTPAARAYAEVNRWLVGARMPACQAKGGLWTAELSREGGYHGRILWAVNQNMSFAIPPDWHAARLRKLDGSQQPVSPGTRVNVGNTPILIESQHPQL